MIIGFMDIGCSLFLSIMKKITNIEMIPKLKNKACI